MQCARTSYPSVPQSRRHCSISHPTKSPKNLEYLYLTVPSCRALKQVREAEGRTDHDAGNEHIATERSHRYRLLPGPRGGCSRGAPTTRSPNWLRWQPCTPASPASPPRGALYTSTPSMLRREISAGGPIVMPSTGLITCPARQPRVFSNSEHCSMYWA